MSGDSYGKEKAYILEKLAKGHEIATSNPHVQTLIRASGLGVASVQSFIASSGMMSHLY